MQRLVQTRFELDLEGRLLSVDSRRVPLYRFDLVLVGSGAAGCAAALAAADAGAEVALLAKGELTETNTIQAQGGVAAVLGHEDSFAAHVEDTLRVGCGLCERDTVERVVRGGPRAIAQLIERGAAFDRSAEGDGLALAREGGHSHARIVHAQGDATGRAIQLALIQAVQRHPRITAFRETFVVDLLCAKDGRVVGVLASSRRGKKSVFSARATVLATGGAGQLYRETTNPEIATGDGIAIALRAGAVVRDLEFVQFHPTMLYLAGAARFLISEVVRGAGAVLRDRHGRRFMAEHHPDAELAPRDVVSRAVFRCMVRTQDTSVYLDLSGLATDPHRLFPGISRICRFFGIDIARDPVPVRPGAHYMVGGIEVDEAGRTSVPGLWAVGECASSGLHGANRMGSNSLLEGLVLGAHAGVDAARGAGRVAIHDFVVRPPQDRETPPSGMQVNVQDVTYSLRSLMWRQLGIERERESMDDALAKIALWTRAVSVLAPPEQGTWELMNMLTVARLVGLSARAREESRGVHHRTDFPAEDGDWRAHTRLAPVFDRGRLAEVVLERVPVRAEAGAPA
jgi:L-aspartate oxidase